MAPAVIFRLSLSTCGHPIFAKPDGMRGAHDPVAQLKMCEAKWLEERVSCHGAGGGIHESGPIFAKV